VATAMDLYPTIAAWAGAELPGDRTIDGRDITDLLEARATTSPHEAVYFYDRSDLEAVRSGRWKLHVRKSGGFSAPPEELEALFDLDADVGETTDVAAENPDVVKRLRALLDLARADLGDSATGVEGTGRRPAGRVDNPVPLTSFDPTHPYYMAEYDLADRG